MNEVVRENICHMRLYLLLVMLYGTTLPSKAQNFTLSLWDDIAPGQKSADHQEIRDTQGIVLISQVHTPTLEVYLPSKSNANGQAILICPGGGYAVLAYDWEGTDIAKMLNSNGIAAGVLKYRLPDPDRQDNFSMVPLSDAQRALRMLRHYAEEWNIKPDQIGVMGFSAGGHLAASLSNLHNHSIVESQYDHTARPDFSILMYPVLAMDDQEHVHQGSKTNLLGDNPSEELTALFSLSTQVSHDTPPTLLIHSIDDDGVPIENSLEYALQLSANDIPYEAHFYPYGGHGFSLAIDQGRLGEWKKLCIDWIKSHNH